MRGTPDGEEAEAILRKCVHCGFCTATCPTYQLLGDELDGPRGRIYLMKQMLEGAPVTRSTQLHLDRCLTCRNCESTCPSGVQYGRLVDIGRKVVEEKVERPFRQRVQRKLLANFLPNSPLFTPVMKLGQQFRPLLPKGLRAKVPAPERPLAMPTRTHARKMLMLAGCVQPAMMPNVNVADRARIRCARHRNRDRAGGRMLRRDPPAPGLQPRRSRRYSQEHRCLVAICREWHRGDRDERLRMRRDGKGVRPPAARRSRVCGQSASDRRADARPG